MPALSWDPETKSTEWARAKQALSDANGRLLRNGTKFRRNDSGLSHSFMVMDNKLLALNGQGLYLGQGIDGAVKLAEDEHGQLYALKIMKKLQDPCYHDEAVIGNDIGQTGKKATRLLSSTKSYQIQGSRLRAKYYLASKHLGIPVSEYYEKQQETLSLDARYDLCIKIALSVHALHTGARSKTKTAYIQGDLHANNILIDDDGNTHIIDFGRSWKTDKLTDDNNKLSNADTKRIFREFFYKPAQSRRGMEFTGVFGDIVPDYALLFLGSLESKYQINLKLINPNAEGKYTTLEYTVLDLNGLSVDLFTNRPTSIGLISLADIDMAPSPSCSGFFADKSIVEQLIKAKNKIIQRAIDNEHIADILTTRHVPLYNILNDPNVTALEMAEMLTLCRLGLDDYQPMLAQLSSEERVDVIQVLNSQSQLILALYADYGSEKNEIEREIKTFLLQHIMGQDATLAALLKRLTIDKNEAYFPLIKQLTDLVASIDLEKKLIAHAKSFHAIVADILPLQTYQSIDVRDALHSLYSDLSDEGTKFFAKKYTNEQDRMMAFRQFSANIDAHLTQAAQTFQDKPGVWPALQLVLKRICGVILALFTLGIAVAACGPRVYSDYFFKDNAIHKAWDKAGIKGRLERHAELLGADINESDLNTQWH